MTDDFKVIVRRGEHWQQTYTLPYNPTRRIDVLEKENTEVKEKYTELEKASTILADRCRKQEALIHELGKQASHHVCAEILDHYMNRCRKQEQKITEQEQKLGEQDVDYKRLAFLKDRYKRAMHSFAGRCREREAQLQYWDEEIKSLREKLIARRSQNQALLSLIWWLRGERRVSRCITDYLVRDLAGYRFELDAGNETIGDLLDEKAGLEKELDTLRSKVDEHVRVNKMVVKEVEKQEASIEQLSRQITAQQEEITIQGPTIHNLERELAAARQEIAQLRKPCAACRNLDCSNRGCDLFWAWKKRVEEGMIEQPLQDAINETKDKNLTLERERVKTEGVFTKALAACREQLRKTESEREVFRMRIMKLKEELAAAERTCDTAVQKLAWCEEEKEDDGK
jgi:chromosome segregation ATPase